MNHSVMSNTMTSSTSSAAYCMYPNVASSKGRSPALGSFGRGQSSPVAPLASSGHDQVLFGEETKKKKTPWVKEKEVTKGGFLSGCRQAMSAIFDTKALLDDVGWCGAFTLILIAIPGHQVFSVPLVFTIGAAIRAFQGFFIGYRGEKYESQSFWMNLWRGMRGKN